MTRLFAALLAVLLGASPAAAIDFRGIGNVSTTGGTTNAIPYFSGATTLDDSPFVRVDANTVEQRNAANVQSFRWTTTYTDASNYERGRLFGVAGTGITIAAETAGTGADNLSITLTPAGTGGTILTSGALSMASGTKISWAADDVTLTHTSNALSLAGGVLAFTDTNYAHQLRSVGDILLIDLGAGDLIAFQAQNKRTVHAASAQATWNNDDTLAAGTPAPDTGLKRASAGVVQVTDGSTGEGKFRVGDGLVSAPGLAFGSDATTGMYRIGAGTIGIAASGGLVSQFDTAGINVPSGYAIRHPLVTAGSGTGVTVNATGWVRTQVYKVTVTYAALAAAGLTADKTIATLPAKTRLVGIVADTTTPYTGGGVTAATMIVGKTTGGNEYLVSHDVLSAAITRGLADGDLGASINRASAIQGGDLPSWTGTTAVSVRLTTVTANTDQLTAGSTTFYLTTEVMP